MWVVLIDFPIIAGCFNFNASDPIGRFLLTPLVLFHLYHLSGGIWYGYPLNPAVRKVSAFLFVAQKLCNKSIYICGSNHVCEEADITTWGILVPEVVLELWSPWMYPHFLTSQILRSCKNLWTSTRCASLTSQELLGLSPTSWCFFHVTSTAVRIPQINVYSAAFQGFS